MLGAQRDARHAGEVRLLLHAAGVGHDRARVAEQRGEVEVAERRREPDVRCRLQRGEQAGIGEARARARVQRQHRRQPAAPAAASTSSAQARRVVDVAGAVRGGEQVAARLDVVGRERLGARARRRLQQLRDVDHHVADELDARRRPTRAAGSRRRSARSTAAATRDGR